MERTKQENDSCVISTKQDEPLKGKLIIPDSKVLFAPMENAEEAHYLCALLSSKVVTDVIEGYTIELQRGIDILENIAIPKFDPANKLHSSLSLLSKTAHENFSKSKNNQEIQAKIDKLSIEIF